MTLARALARLALAPALLFAACTASSPSETAVGALGYAALLPIGGGNALTLPAQRHLVRVGGTLLLALQQDGASGHYLGMFRSDDDGGSFYRIGGIQDSAIDRDTADLVVVGQDLALVYSYEGPALEGSSAHDVYFQWWRQRNGSWSPDPAVRVFASPSSNNGYYRAELAIDSLGRLWVQSFFLQNDGSATAAIAVSTDGGAHFAAQPPLANLPYRGGGRILGVGARLVFVYDGHDDGTHPAHLRVRDDAAPLGSWGPEQVAFAEGIYHGAALSAVADGHGGMHLVYKDKNAVLWYRGFDGARFGAAQLVEDVGDWELQPAVTRIGDDLVIFYNRVYVSNTNDEVRVRTLHQGTLSAPRVLDASGGFKGYPAAVDALPTSIATVHSFFGDTPDANSAGQATLYTIAWTPTTAPPPDMTTAPPPDLATGGGGGGALLFSDRFNRQIPPDNGLGAGWALGAGLWFTNGNAVSDRDGGDLAGETAVQCRDCRVDASVTGFGVAETGIYLRAPSATSANRYELVLLGNGHVQIRRVIGGVATTLGDAASGVAALDQPATLSLQATGAAPVTLVAQVDGRTRLTASDGSGAALVGAGNAGLWTSNAGVVFGNFELWTAAGGASAPDLGAPADLAPPPRDLAPPTGGTLFSDDFNRQIPPDDGLGANWTIGGGGWFSNGRAVADVDGLDLAAANVARCADCSAQASVVTYGTTGGVYLRAPSPASADRYDLVLLANGHAQIRRVRAGAVTVLGDAPSGVATFDQPALLALTASGSSPVTLTGRVNGATRLTVRDASSAALGDGYAGLWSSNAGVPFSNFVLSAP